MRPVILFRREIAFEGELLVAQKYFTVYEQRCAIPEDSLVFGRYSVLPYYKELEKDLLLRNCRLANTYEQHRWIADFEYYQDLQEYTPESWDDTNFYRCQHPGPFVVKGKTNSRKHNWNTHMFAKDKRAAIDIASELIKDSMIGCQGIIYRKFVPLKVLGQGINGLPYANEWRCFYYKGERISYGYYWSISDNIPTTMDLGGLEFADEVAKKAAEFVDFFVLDVAEKEEGGWTLIEVNDAQCSGISENDPYILYHKLKHVAERHEKDRSENRS